MDRFKKGFIAGVTGGVLMNIWSYTSFYMLDFTETKFSDWAGVVVFSRIPKTLSEIILAIIIQLVFAGSLGVIFAYLLKKINSKDLYLKSLVFTITLGFTIYSIPKLFKIDHLYYIATKTTISNFIGAIIWALTMARVLKWLDNREKLDY